MSIQRFVWEIPFLLFFLILLTEGSRSPFLEKWKLKPDTTAIVTGGTKGIGKAIVDELCNMGCHVLTCSRSEEDLENCLEEWKKIRGVGQVDGIVADVSTEKGRESIVSKANDLFDGSLDILVNNVGTNIRKKTEEYELSDLEFILKTNFVSCFEMSKLAYNLLKRERNSESNEVSSHPSSIINIGSVAGVTCMKSGTPYAATKAAMNQLTGNLCCEVRLKSNDCLQSYTQSYFGFFANISFVIEVGKRRNSC